MRKIALTFSLLCLIVTGWSQNINYTAWIYRFSSWETSCNQEIGTEEYTRKGWIMDNSVNSETYSGCNTCNNNGDCQTNGSWASQTRSNIPATQVRVRLDAWEDDNGDRCTYHTAWNVNDDDCRVTDSDWTTLNPVEYQNTTNNWETGNGNHRAYARVNYQYATVSLNSAVENSSTSFSTGGSRPFWGSRGAWSSVGGDCATSGTITHNQTSSFSTTVSCRSSVTFRWRVSSEANYDFLRFYINGVQQNAISGNVGWATITYPLNGGTNTLEWRYTKDGSVSSFEDRGFVDDISFVNLSSLDGGIITGAQTICSGNTPSALAQTTGASVSTVVYQWQRSLNGTTGWTNIAGATGNSYTPPASTTTYYYRRRAQVCGITGYSNTITVTVSPNSTAPIVSGAPTNACPNTTTTLSAAGGVSGPGSVIEWYSGPNGTGTNLGSGATLNVSPTSDATYYVRREGTCNTSADNVINVSVKDFVYAPTGTTVSTGYCTDNNGWHHFYNASDEIILSVQGDLSGVTGTPVATINNNGSFYQQTEGPGTPGGCAANIPSGEERFEMSRSWNLDVTGTLNPPYSVRFYHPASERTAIETAAQNHMTAYPACGYTPKYPSLTGFYYFKNNGSTYTPADYDGTHLTAANGTVASLEYAELSGITSFSGGSGGLILSPFVFLPVELISFTGENVGRVNELSWSTAAEINNSHFEIERSESATDNFVKIGQVTGAGNSSQLLTYNFTDENPIDGVNYYRLRQVDLDGSETYSKTIALKMGAVEAHLLYPNPTEGILIYSFESKADQVRSVIVEDLAGRRILTKKILCAKGKNSETLDLKLIEPGTYIVTVFDEKERKLHDEKVVVQ